ncbi:MAG: NAD(P)/FAD-dependent oxidoreductase [Nanobdellota archaeon]
MKVVIIGGGSAGTTCAFEVRKRDKDAEITILEKGDHPEYSPCALPYVISGEIDIQDIFLFKQADYSANDIHLSLNSSVDRIDREKKTIVYTRQGETKELSYDKLVLAMGSHAFVPRIEGMESTRYKVLKTLEDAREISDTPTGDSVVIGAGMIGVELAHSLAQRGDDVTLLEADEHILPGILDKGMAKRLHDSLQFTIYEGVTIDRIAGNKVFAGERFPFDNLFLCTGIRPNMQLAQECGLETEKGIVVNEYLQTSDEEIYACGDCTQVVESNTGNKIVSGLGTTAVRQAQVIATNILGVKETFPPVVNNSVTKLGDYVGSVGLTSRRARDYGIQSVSAEYCGPVRAEYYPSDERIAIRIVSDTSGKVIGGQFVGAEVVGRLNLIALAIQKGMHVQELAALETCYNPASAPIFDPVSITAQICLRKLR